MSFIRLRSVLPVLIAVLAFAVVATTQAGPSVPAPMSPSGNSPREALDVDCAWKNLSPTSSVWYRLASREGKPLRVELVSYPETLAEMEFHVYGAQGGEESTILMDSLGRGQVTDTRFAHDWEGKSEAGTAYFVNVVNLSAKIVGYGLCDLNKR